MRRVMLLMWVALSMQSFAQSGEELEAIMRLVGTTNPEDMDSYEVERLGDFLQRPLKINSSSLSEVECSGLLTPYQLASLTDYRMRHGDVMSYAELAAIDGFGPDLADMLRPFVSLDTGAEAKSGASFRYDVQKRAGYRSDDEDRYMYGTKCRMQSRHASASFAFSRPYGHDEWSPDTYSGNLVWNHAIGKVVIGDFNARFGQGLCLWNTSVIGGLASPSAFMRKPSGLSPSFSFTGSSALKGIAADVSMGKWKVSAFMAASEINEQMRLMPAVNVSTCRRYGMISITHYTEFSDFLKDASAYRIPLMKSSVDASLCVRGVNLFGEFTYDWVERGMSALCGTDFMACDIFRLAALVERIHLRSMKMAFSGELKNGRMKRHSGNFSVIASVYPEDRYAKGVKSVEVKGQTDWLFAVSDRVSLKLKLTERFRTWGHAFKTGARIDVKYASEHLSGVLRMDFLRCVGNAFLGYVEGGYSEKSMNVFLRMGIFRIDDWEDRIYVYERDAPGSFNVPAYYGRGVWAAANMSWKYAAWGKLYVRVSYTGYPLMHSEKRKPGRAELKVQSVFRF